MLFLVLIVGGEYNEIFLGKWKVLVFFVVNYKFLWWKLMLISNNCCVGWNVIVKFILGIFVFYLLILN